MLRVLIAGLALLSLLSCGSRSTLKGLVSEKGDTAVVELQSGKLKGELLAIGDSLLYVIPHGDNPETPSHLRGRVVGIDPAGVRSIRIEGYSDKMWIAGVIGFEVIPAILMGIAAASVDGDTQGGLTVAGILMVPAAVTAAIFAAATPKTPGAAEPLTIPKLESLRKYARYSQGLSQDQLAHLRLRIGQSDEVMLRE